MVNSNKLIPDDISISMTLMTPNSFYYFNQYCQQSFQWQVIVALVSAIMAAFSITPIILVVDKAVILAANGKKNLINAVFQEIRQFLHPVKFITGFEFRWVFFVYVLTYSAANTSPLLCKLMKLTLFSPSLAKLAITFIVNTFSSMLKDKALAQKLGKSTSKPFPSSSLILFFIRDIIAMASAFTIPSLLTLQLQTIFRIDHSSSLKIAQILSPMLTQLVTTFIQLFALDLYNRQTQTLKNRINYVKTKYRQALLVRIIGFTAAYGLGGIINFQVKGFMENYNRR